MLRVSDVAFGYVPEQTLFKDVSFTIESGEFLAVGGRNGCGKTTITRLLVGLETPRTGRIFYNDTDITGWTPAKRSQYIGYVFQQPDRQMFRPTVAQEVAFGPEQQGYSRAEVKEITAQALERVRLSDKADAYPPLLHRGEKQRVAIASALAMQSEILILDEPTSGQDGTETKELLGLLQSLRKDGLAIVLITHDMEIIASQCSRVLVMGNQTKAFDGSPEELFTKRDDLEALGLERPACVSLSMSVPSLGYCASMEEFTKRMITYKQQGGR